MTQLYRWPGGVLHEVRPLDQAETETLCDILGTEDHTTVESAVNMAFLNLSEGVERKLSRKAAEREARKLSKLLILADHFGMKTDDLIAAADHAGWNIMKSVKDEKANRPLGIVASNVIRCADLVCGEAWTLPSARDLDDENEKVDRRNEKVDRRVLQFALAVVALACERLRELPKRKTFLVKLDKISARSMRDALAKWRHVTITDALAKMGTANLPRSGK